MSRSSWDIGRCLEEIERGSGKQFDPELSKELIAMFSGATVGLSAAPSVRYEPLKVRAVA